MLKKQITRKRIHTRIRSRIMGTQARPRLCVFKSINHIYAQLIDDENGKVLVAVSDVKSKKGTKTSNALEIGKTLAKNALAKKIEAVVFDRGGFVYQGSVKAVADGAREGGLKF